MAICYKTKDGRSCLYRISYCTREVTQARVDALNANKPLKDGLEDLSHVDYFFVDDSAVEMY